MLVNGFCYLGSHVETDGGSGPDFRQRVGIAHDCMSNLQPWDLEVRHPLWYKALPVYDVSIASPPVWRRDVDTHQGLENKAGCLPTLVPQADTVHPLFGAHYQLGNLSASGPGFGIRNGLKQKNPAIQPHHTLLHQAGPREGFESNDRGSSEKLEEARRPSAAEGLRLTGSLWTSSPTWPGKERGSESDGGMTWKRQRFAERLAFDDDDLLYVIQN